MDQIDNSSSQQYRRYVVLIGFLLSLILFVSISFFSWRVLSNQRKIETTMNQALRHLELIDQIKQLLQDAVIGERGFIITGQASHLSHYNKATNSLQVYTNLLLNKTQTLAKGSIAGDSLKDAIHETIALMDQRIADVKTGHAEEVRTLIKSRSIESETRPIQNMLNQEKEYNKAILADRISSLHNNTNRSMWIYFIGIFLGIILFVFVYVYLTHQVELRGKAEHELRESRERLREAQRIAHLGHWEWDINKDTVDWSHEVYRIFGLEQGEFDGTFPAFLELVHPDDRPKVEKAIHTVLEGEQSYRIEHRILRPDGQERYVTEHGEIEYDEVQNGKRLLGTLQDITRRKWDEQAIREREELLRSIVRNAPVVIFVVDRDGIFKFSEGKALQMLNLQPNEVNGHSIYDVYKNQPEIIKNIERALDGEEFTATVDIGKVVYETRYSPVVEINGQIEGVLGVAADITDRQRAEEQLHNAYVEMEYRVQERTAELAESNQILNAEIQERARVEERLRESLHEKEVLLQEIHHRVKNNLQVISSLLYLQANRVDNAGATGILTESQNRIRSMALIHEKLYQSGDFTDVDFSNYLNEISGILQRTYADHSRKIKIRVNAEHVRIGLDTAIPCGLIVNELISNALKHAFNGRDQGEIEINMHSLHEDKVQLGIRDNGIGYPKDFDFKHAKSLGLQLIHNLVKQISGTLVRENTQGTGIRITFSKSSNSNGKKV